MASTRNKNAGKSTGKSKSAKYFASHPKAKANKDRISKAVNSQPEQKKKRAELNKITRKKPTGTTVDNSHTKSGKIVREKRSTNRSRNGRGGKSTKK